MDNATLQKQFLQLQDEQHKRLLKLKQKQASQSKRSNEMEKSNSSFGVSDDLNLDTSNVSASSTVGLNVALEAANTSMREELRELQDETGRLRKSLAERDYEIKRLNRKIEKTEEEKRLLAGAGIASDSVSTKIVDLSKKNRDLTAQLEAEKSKCLRFQQKNLELERKLAYLPLGGTGEQARLAKASVMHQSLSGSLKSPNNETMEELQDQLNQANLKTTEYRNQIQALKQDMKIALKVLSQETGENQANLQALLNNGGQGYRGRAQQVIALQNRIRELEQKLKADLDVNPKLDKNIARIKTMEITRREQADALKENLSKLQEQLSETNRKLEASKARSKVLISEIKSQKSQIAMLTDKGTHDNELIATLMRQQESLQKMLERSSASHDSSTRAEIKINKELYDRKQQESAEITRIKQVLIEKEQRIRELEEQVNMSDSLDEDEHKPLAVFTSPSNSQHQITDNQVSPSSSNSSGEVEQLQKRCIELKTLYDASETELQHLVKMVSSLNSRLEESAKKIEQGIGEVHEQKKKSASLELQIETLRNSLKSDGNATSQSEGVTPSKELQAQLLIQKDENNALKEALESTLRNKRNDITMYEEMTKQTKQVFIEALRSFTAKK
ncbi:coiled-coil domain-containing protein 13-like [Clavelina lepadiformis]|uniref:coiled-coil domain-containing protein 13-like n=1 Tax=Clavelina lepadiformis TaxID=159417 RepID=UPI004041EF31